jgi:phosphatidylserine decarboxylase
VVGVYARLYDIEFSECLEHEGWTNFDAFFTRRLCAREVDRDPRAITSPADGRVEAMGSVHEGGTFVVKGRPYAVEELLGDDREEARRFVGGAGCVIYLAPRDYHRVHAPVGGSVRRIRSMGGDFFPVNSIGMQHVANLLCRNRRVAIEIDADGDVGRVTVIMVVAMIVGRITTMGIEARDVPFGDHVFDPPLRVSRGDEIGVFHLGSTAVVLVEERAAGRWLVQEGPVRYGQAILRARDVRDGGRG